MGVTGVVGGLELLLVLELEWELALVLLLEWELALEVVLEVVLEWEWEVQRSLVPRVAARLQ
jgi:hypothetical protein